MNLVFTYFFFYLSTKVNILNLKHEGTIYLANAVL